MLLFQRESLLVTNIRSNPPLPFDSSPKVSYFIYVARYAVLRGFSILYTFDYVNKVVGE